MTFGEKLLRCIKNAGYTQKQLSEKIGVTPVCLNYWIKDKRQPDIPMIRILASTLGVSSDYLIGNDQTDRKSAIDLLVAERNLRETDRSLIEGVLSLTPEQRDALASFAINLVDAARREAKELTAENTTMQDAQEEPIRCLEDIKSEDDLDILRFE